MKFFFSQKVNKTGLIYILTLLPLKKFPNVVNKSDCR